MSLIPTLYHWEVPNCPGLLMVQSPVFPKEVSIYFYFYIAFFISVSFGERGGKKKTGFSQPSVTSSLNFPALLPCLCVSICEHVLQLNGTVAPDRKTSCFPPHFSPFWSSVPHRQWLLPLLALSSGSLLLYFYVKILILLFLNFSIVGIIYW